MGEISDMMIDGTLDAHTGEYLGRGHGIPRTRDKSLPWEQHSLGSQYRGVTKFLSSKGYDLKDHHKIMQMYLDFRLNVPEEYQGGNYKKKAEYIQNNWTNFVNWLKANKPVV